MGLVLGMTPEAKYLLENIEEFAVFALEILEGHVYELAPHQKLILHTLERVLSGEITRLIINIPPGSAKTSLTVWVFIAYLFALNPASKMLHVSYSDALVRSNSGRIKNIIESSDYQSLFPWVKLKSDTTAKNMWETDVDGTLRAAATGSAVTGFRAGRLPTADLSAALQGMMIIDDPNPPKDAGSDVKMQSVNDHWDNTLKSRLATENTPVILIQQRIAEDDLSGYLLETEQWHHLLLPVLIEDREYNDGGIPVSYDLPPGSLWTDKWTPTEARALMEHIQYSQLPSETPGDIFEKHMFPLYDSLPELKSVFITADTATKTNAWNDFTVFTLFGKSYTNDLFVIDIVRGKFKITDLLGIFKQLLIQAYDTPRDKNHIKIYIEEYASGEGLIQALALERVYATGVTRKSGKYARALEAIHNIKTQCLHFPRNHELTPLAIKELCSFRADDSHSHDDIVDTLLDGVNFEVPKITPGASFRISNL